MMRVDLSGNVQCISSPRVMGRPGMVSVAVLFFMVVLVMVSFLSLWCLEP